MLKMFLGKGDVDVNGPVYRDANELYFLETKLISSHA